MRWKAQFLKKVKEDCNASYVKTIAWSIAVKEVTNTLIFYIFEYGAKYIAEFSAESSPKSYFIKIYYLKNLKK